MWWRSFDDNDITSRAVPIKLAFIDASTIRNNAAASRYVVDVVRDSLSKEQRVDLALSYRVLKDSFMDDAKVKGVNSALAKIAGESTVGVTGHVVAVNVGVWRDASP